jgi:hypothetical protein
MKAEIKAWTEEQYRAHPAANYSVLKHASRSAAHMAEAMQPTEPNAAMLLGSLTDWLLFSEGKDQRFAVAPRCDRRTKEGKEMWQRFADASIGKVVIDQEDLWKAEAMVQAIRRNQTAMALISGNQYQVPIVWEDEDTGVECKALLDSVTPKVTITDLKTTQNADWREFSRSCANFGYYMQAAYYIDAYKAATGEELPYTFIAVENTKPHAVAVYRLDDAAIEAGRQRYKDALSLYAECKKNGCWPAYPEHLQVLEMPGWVLAAARKFPELEDPF